MSEINTIRWEISQLVKTRLFSDEQAVSMRDGANKITKAIC